MFTPESNSTLFGMLGFYKFKRPSPHPPTLTASTFLPYISHCPAKLLSVDPFMGVFNLLTEAREIV